MYCCEAVLNLRSNVPWNSNVPTEPDAPPAPLPSGPSVTMYLAVTILPVVNFLPKNPSPKRISIFSSWTSCIKNISESLFKLRILSIFLYSLPSDTSLISFLTLTLMVEESILALSKTNP